MMTLMIMAGECKRQRCNDHLLAGWGRAGSSSCKVFFSRDDIFDIFVKSFTPAKQSNSQMFVCVNMAKHGISEMRGVGHSSQKLLPEMNFWNFSLEYSFEYQKCRFRKEGVQNEKLTNKPALEFNFA